MTLKRNLKTEEGRKFWANIDRVKEQIKQLPKWMQDELKRREEAREARKEMTDRTLFGKPLRDISLMCNTETQSLSEFIEDMRSALLVYQTNIQNLGKDQPEYFGNKEHYPEHWVESFLAWYELEQDPDA